MSALHPELLPVHQLRQTLSKMHTIQLSVGEDGRSRNRMRPFAAVTGRCQPSTTKFIFGTPGWTRHLLKPSEGRGLALLDWEQQEFAIAAFLSGDVAMQRAYCSGDPYLAFAIRAGAVPEFATKATHSVERGQYKECALGVLFGLGARGLAKRIGATVTRGIDLIEAHKRSYPVFWKWSDSIVDYADVHGRLTTTFGWNRFIEDVPDRVRSMRNFPMQANGTEMMMIAANLMTERGVQLCATVHDGFLIESALQTLDADISIAVGAMAEASSLVLDGFEIRSDVEIVRWPNSYVGDKGGDLWTTIQASLERHTPFVEA